MILSDYSDGGLLRVSHIEYGLIIGVGTGWEGQGGLAPPPTFFYNPTLRNRQKKFINKP